MKLTNYTEVKQLLERHGFRFSKSMGQNFLIADWVPESIADNAMLDENTGVLEVGPGVGCLTEQLGKRAGKVVSVELDNALRPVLKETLSAYDNISIHFGDVMKTDIRKLCDESFPGMKKAVCANLPYNITSPLITAFIEADCFDTITVMIQREVAKRICAAPATADYGAFGIFVQWYYETELLFDVSPACFIPQPKVTSTVIRLKKRSQPVCSVKDEKLMMKIIRAAFNQRRKTLVNALASGIGIGKSAIADALNELGLDVNVRGETLDIVYFAKLTDKICEIT